MIKVVVTILLLIAVFLLPNHVFAHPGRTDSSGCHTCRTNCPKWGLDYGEYHCHGGYKTAPKSTAPTYSKIPTSTPYTSLKTTPIYNSKLSLAESSTNDNSSIFYLVGVGVIYWLFRKWRQK